MKTEKKISPDMAEGTSDKPKLEIVPDDFDEDEAEFRALRRDLPGVKGAGAVGIVSIGVAKLPGKNEFFRTHPEFRPVVPIVDLEVGMEKQFFAVTDEMVEALASIGITVSNHTLYLTVTSRGGVKIVPVRCADADGDQNEYNRTKRSWLAYGSGGMVPAVHRQGKPNLQSASCPRRTVCGTGLARPETSEDIPARVP
jgi:hypothetical protein